MPAVATGIAVRYVDVAAPWLTAVGGNPTGTTRSPAIVARVALRYDETKADLIHDDEYEAVLFPLAEQLDVTALVPVDYDDRDLQVDAPADVSFDAPGSAGRHQDVLDGGGARHPRSPRAHADARDSDQPGSEALRAAGRDHGLVRRTGAARSASNRAATEIAASARQVRGQGGPGARPTCRRGRSGRRAARAGRGETQLGGTVDRRVDARWSPRRPQVGREHARWPPRQGRDRPPVGGAARRRPTNA